ncbi:MAG: class I SAM-dependent methyltransferase [Saprospiraceae bacterium]|nr:class I SAM-dependent methyltransferase [Saprospiraceae bacterium]
MLFKLIQSDKNISDTEFNKIYPHWIRELALTDFSPLEVSKVAVGWLSEPGISKILDIGAGAGKFCTIGASVSTAVFYGVEQRIELCTIGKEVCERFRISNVDMIHANVMDIAFKDYDAFYFFNSFHENLSVDERMDDTVMLNRELYKQYSDYVREQLNGMPDGTKVVTYFSHQREIPACYQLQCSDFDQKLKLWIKTAS